MALSAFIRDNFVTALDYSADNCIPLFQWAKDLILAEAALIAATEQEPAPEINRDALTTLRETAREAREAPEDADAPAPETPKPVIAPDPAGESGAKKNGNKTAADFKRETRTRLSAYRQKHGLGCFAPVAERTGKEISPEMITGMMNGLKYSIREWRLVAAALDEMEQEENHERNDTGAGSSDSGGGDCPLGNGGADRQGN